MSAVLTRPATAEQLRAAWCEFFAGKAHAVVPSSSLIPTHPSAPMFTNSGMMPFVSYFLGEEPVPYDPPRAASVQRCVRAGGKHNDLDAIGRSLRHLSFFEMMGNFSFGDYFKSDAIPWAWEFLTEVLGIDGDRLWITCHLSDDEAEEVWADSVGVPRDRIQRLDKDNFWEMGETGPCGPSSEIFWDYGPDLGPAGGPANPLAEDRYVEIWNLVFTQYFRGTGGELTDLPKANVDTGAGLERILAVLAGSPSLYSADVLSLLVEEAQAVTGKRIGSDNVTDIGLRLLADHTRTASFLISDGIVPSNEGRGYVLRMIIRRAVRFGYMLGVSDPVLPAMVNRCVDVMGGAYPELRTDADGIVESIAREEDRFRRTLDRGSSLLESELEKLPEGESLGGGIAFELHDTYGFPLEVTREVAELRGASIDEPGFATAMAEQRERSRAAGKKGSVAAGGSVDVARAILNSNGPTEFVGRETDTADATVLAVVEGLLILDRTPFYAESGGQVGDTGTISAAEASAKVLDTTYLVPGLSAHKIETETGRFDVGDAVTATIDSERRAAIKRNHTATHILHWALREVLGDQVRQQGSHVSDDRLRFDFSHHSAVSADDLRTIEDLANAEVLDNSTVSHFETSMDDARKRGAIAFFGDKYGDVVRVLTAGEHSIELCGGTHVSALGDIGLIKVISEGSIGSNVRRIEAVTGAGSLNLLRDTEARLGEVAETLGVPVEDALDGLRKRLGDLKGLRSELKELRGQLAGSAADTLVSEAVDGVLVALVESESRDEVRDLAVALRDKPNLSVVVLGSSPGGKGVALVAAVTPEAGLIASDLIREAAKMVGGGGGPSDDLAVAGGRHPEKLIEALEVVRAGLGL